MATFLDPKYTFVHDGTQFKNPNSISLLKVTQRGYDRIDGPKRDYRLFTNGVLGPPKTQWESMKRTRAMLLAAPAGKIDLRVRAYDSVTDKLVDSVRFFKTAPSIPVTDTPGVEGIDRISGYLNTFYAKERSFRYAGICVCKPDSDHRDCAAIDWFDTADKMNAQRDYFLEPRTWDYVHGKYLILWDRIHFGPGDSQHHTGEYHRHIHLSVNGGIPGKAC
jgi:hypothetical protein